jgi:hypothetical protein
MHGGSVHIQQVFQDGAAPDKALLSRKHPLVQYRLPAESRGAGDEAIVSIDDVEWACVSGCVSGCAFRSGGVCFLGQARHSAVVVVMWVMISNVVICVGQKGFKIVLRKAGSDICQNIYCQLA